MTSMPDAVAAPPRPAPAQRSGSASDDARGGDFDSFVDDTAEDEPDEGAARPDRLRERRDPRPDGAATAQAAATQAVAQAVVRSGGAADPPLMPWLVQAAPVAATAMPPATTGAGSEAGTPEATVPGMPLPAQTGQVTADAGHAATPAPSGAPRPLREAVAGSSASTPVSTTSPAPAADAMAPSSAGPATPDETGRMATVRALSPAIPATAAPAPSATAGSAVPVADGRAERRVETTDPRTAGHAARGNGRQTAAAGTGQPGMAPAAPAPGKAPAGEASPSPVVAETSPDPAAPQPTGAAGTAGAGGSAAAAGFEALPTLPAQAATHYAAAAASGRATTAHSPAMAQLAAPLVRVLEAGGGEFHIDLAPADLGRIRVVADVSDGKVALTVQAEQADTLVLLRRDLQQLERALGDAGLSLDNANLQFSLQGDGQSRGYAAPDRGTETASRQMPAVTETVPDHTDQRPMRPIDGLVDVTV